MAKLAMAEVRSDQPACALEALEARRLLSATAARGFSLGPGDIETIATTADPAGNTIVLGKFGGVVDFDPRAGPTHNVDGGDSLNSTSSPSYFVARYGPSRDLRWVVPVVAGDATGTPPTFEGLATDAQGNVYVSGTLRYGFDANPSSRRKRITASEDSTDALVWKLSPDGGLVFAATQHFPSTRTYQLFNDEVRSANHVVVDAAGSVYLAGMHESWEDATERPFLTRFSPAGQVMWTAELPEGEADALTLDRTGGPALLSHGMGFGSDKVFLLRYNGRGRRLADDVLLGFNNYIGIEYLHAHTSPAASIAFDAAGNIVVSGSLWSGVDFDPGPGELIEDWPARDFNAYVAKYTPDRHPIFARVLGGKNAVTIGAGAAVDPKTGNIFVAGSIVGRADLNPTKGGTLMVDSGDADLDDFDDVGDLFVAKFDAKGRFVTARALSMPSTDEVAYAMAVAPGGRVAVVGASSGWPNFEHALALLLDEIS